MKHITAAELVNKSGFELSALYAKIKDQLAQTKPGTYEHEGLASSLDNIRRAYAARMSGPKF